MIAKQVKGKSFIKLLKYLFGKEGARQIGGNMDETTPRSLAAELHLSKRINPKVSRTVYHASLSLPHNEGLDDDTWHEIALKYLRAMGFTMNQYIVVRHTDRTHDHAHIVASRIRLDGTTVSDSWDYTRSEAVIRRLEKEYNLQSVKPSKKKEDRSPTTGERRQLARTGEESVRVKLQYSLDKATHDHPTMPELIERAQQQGINVCVGYTRTGKVKGISYQFDGVAFSGTHLGKAYTFPGLQKHRGVNYVSKRDDQLIQKLIERNVKNATSSHAERNAQHIQLLTNQTAINATTIDNSIHPLNQSNSLPTPKPANWKQIRQNLNQQYNLPVSLLNELYQKGWLYPSQTGQPVFIERTLDDVPTLAKQLEPTGDFTAIPLNSETTKNGSFWIATDTTVTRAVLLSDPIEVLSVIALESTVDKRKRQPTLYWSVGDRSQIPLEFLDSLDTVVIAFKDNEKVEDLISDLLTELPQSKRVSPGQAGWNQLLSDRKQPVKKQQFTQTLDWEI
ncbi:relaxase/mobilization nuclease domain-containing protein [Anabaena sphaerica FACHB-251]|uniref:Relaxase/mobilization nuclease domain-containing protein n=1 Tax=Anabaena sphaerica FACHB-251 TaxID=2692883 RepID=A0A926WIH9_9NOST|nr:relaxase/mobilization nuclease domain-containing protein [Anabaena sphaerica]MBD2295062.1 relaxase/mobilization nuclease domain-containing protein [Anabaena sphaerica FACHB-251]